MELANIIYIKSKSNDHANITNRYVFLRMLIAVTLVFTGCTKGDKKTEIVDSEQNYIIKRITLGTFSVQEGTPYAKHDANGINWMTMSKGSLAINDEGKIFILSDKKLHVLGIDGKVVEKVELRDIGSCKQIGPIEVSSDGSQIYVRCEGKNSDKYLAFDKTGKHMESKEKLGFIRRSCKDIYFEEKYAINEHAIELAELNVLDGKLNRVKNLNNYYLPETNLNEKPKGFFDSDWNYYYMNYWPEVTKLNSAGAVLWQKKILSKAENWRLIGIDSESNLYALVSEASHNTIIKIDKNLKVLAQISLAEIEKNFNEEIESDGSEVADFLVTCKGDVYFVPNHMDSVNPEFEFAYREYRKRGEYSIYKIERKK